MTIPIQQITLHHLRMELKNPFTTSFGTVANKDFYITEIVDGEGHQGFGESVAFTAPWYTEETFATTGHVMKDFLIPILLDNPIKHPDDVSELFTPIKRNNMAKAALEGAVWDLYAKREDITLARALGGTKTEIEAGIAIGMQPSIEQLLHKIEKSQETGYKRVKLKIKPGKDIDVLRTVRHHYPDLPIMVDANSAYSLEETSRLQELDAFELMMIEQPLAHDDIVDHAKLQAKINTPICLDESIHSLEDAKKAVELGSCHVINIKPGRVGGLTVAKQIHDYCIDNDIAVWCGGMLEAGVGRAQNIALSALKGFQFPGDNAGSANYWEKDIISPEVVAQQGVISVPTDPGIGHAIDSEAFVRFKVNEENFLRE
ncbi:o-succinylbenzoate synthase [Oceanobacillus manasiensis]|uniref:o-succinylbenzoate synthase n=1 Tax=Oceanobacillus manasiensis TaxID=586413 RepID=UPI0005A73696|nr:o-succinylbenzoate synthase [Oceanobacillus manasiensis]